MAAAGFDPPAQDSAGLGSAAQTLGTVVTDLSAQLKAVTTAIQTAVAQWTGTRATDFAHGVISIVDEMSMTVTAVNSVAGLLKSFSTTVSTAAGDIAFLKQRADSIQSNAEKQSKNLPDSSPQQDTIFQHAGTARGALLQQAQDIHDGLNTKAVALAHAIDTETDLAVPKSSTLSPQDIRRRVDSAAGVTGLKGVTADNAWDVLLATSNPIYGGVPYYHPVPGDLAFQAWFANLTGVQKQMELDSLRTQTLPTDFDPYSTVQGGDLPAWAVSFNNSHGGNVCLAPGVPQYGYIGGGSIAGPGGVQWPIVMPYLRDGKYVYLDDSGKERDDGGINQLDGNDPGWTTISTYTGEGKFGSVSTSTKAIVFGEIFTGQEIETTPTDAGAVRILPDGKPELASEPYEPGKGPPDKPYWDVESPLAFPEGNETTEALTGASALTVQFGQGVSAVHNIDSHGQRQWYVAYQVNADGRTRAIVHTYTAGPNEDGGGTNIGSFANTFPTGQKGVTLETSIDVRHTEYTSPTLTQVPDKDVHVIGDEYQFGELVENQTPISEQLDK